MTPDYGNPQAPSTGKEEVKAWLRATGRDRAWLAARCGVGKRTVDNWLSSPREIPPKARFIINSLMREREQSGGEGPLQNLVLQVDEATFDKWNRAALVRQMTLKDWAVDALNKAARSYPAELPFPSSKVAEEPD